MRFLASLCVLAVLFAVAVPAAAGPPAILAAMGPVLGAPCAFRFLRAPAHGVAPDLSVAASVPARAPPLA